MSTSQQRLTPRVQRLLVQRASANPASLEPAVSAYPHETNMLAGHNGGRSTTYVRMNVGGPLEGVVALTTTGAQGVIRIEATWGNRYARERVVLTRVSEREARTVAGEGGRGVRRAPARVLAGIRGSKRSTAAGPLAGYSKRGPTLIEREAG